MAPLKRARSLSVLRWLLLLPIPLVWCALDYSGKLTFLENKSIDWRFQYRGEIDAPVKVVYVDVDSLSLSEIGGWPWSRTYFAQVASALINEAKVKAVGFDFVFSDAGVSESVDLKKLVYGNMDFGRFLFKQPPVVLAAAYAGHQFLDVRGQKLERALPLMAVETRKLEDIEPPEVPVFMTGGTLVKPQLTTPPIAVGLIDTLGGETRTVPAWAPDNLKRTFFHMSLELARLYWGLPRGSLVREADKIVFKRPDGSVQATVPLLREQLLEVNWFTRWQSPRNPRAEFSTVCSYAQMLSSEKEEERRAAKEFFAQAEFTNAIVLIGPVDPLLQDVAPTSLDEHAVPKVGVHGNLVKTIIAGKFLTRIPNAYNYAIVLGLTLVVTSLSLGGGARPLVATLTALAGVVIYAVLVLEIFKRSHTVLPFTAPLGAALTTNFAGLIWQVIEVQKAKGRIKGMFGAYVSPQLVERMVESGEDPQLGGHDAEITAYFSDIQGFSTFSEKLGSGPLVQLMNEYLTVCTDIVQEEGGTLDKYIGDAVVAMFGAPIPMKDHAYRACVASQRVHQKIGELRAKWKSEGDKWPEIVWKMQSRIGLNTGVCMIGNMGSRTRFNYTMMGDDVNLAARMESGAKSWGAYSMVTQTTKNACEQHGADRVVFRALGRIVVMGRSQPVPIYEIIGLKESLPDRARECIGIFEQGLAKYYAREWDAAIALFSQSAELEPNQPGKTPGVKTNPSHVYTSIAEDYKISPPAEGWDGVYVMKEK
ncbi:MAG: adenylate/guanylate cyclase domain-containing protein [Opitutaceae bacterium]|nr:adenylate/guanylate cyclase domain-containing protein [Opitutaceae bacterium]